MTAEELAALGVSRELFHTWYDLLDSIWQKLISLYGKRKIRNSQDNSILITHRGIKLEVLCNFVNREYIAAVVLLDGNEVFDVRHYDDLKATTLCVSLFIHQFLTKL